MTNDTRRRTNGTQIASKTSMGSCQVPETSAYYLPIICHICLCIVRHCKMTAKCSQGTHLKTWHNIILIACAFCIKDDKAVAILSNMKTAKQRNPATFNSPGSTTRGVCAILSLPPKCTRRIANPAQEDRDVIAPAQQICCSLQSAAMRTTFRKLTINLHSPFTEHELNTSVHQQAILQCRSQESNRLKAPVYLPSSIRTDRLTNSSASQEQP